jgi:hypothetical protein
MACYARSFAPYRSRSGFRNLSLAAGCLAVNA